MTATDFPPALPRHLRSRAAAFAHDLVMVPVAWFGAYWLRYNLESIPAPFFERAMLLSPLVLAAQGVVFWYFGLYRGVWRFASVPDLMRIAKAVLAGVAVLAVLVFLLTRMQYVPRSVLPLYAGLLFGLLGGPRLLYRWTKDHKLENLTARRALVIGSGDAAEILLRDMLRRRDRPYVPVALVDDNPGRQGREIHGIRVLGAVEDVPELARTLDVELVLIAIPSVTARQMRRVVEICERAGVPFRTLPPLRDLVSGEVTVNALREVSIEDLLGRAPVSLDWDQMRSQVAGRRVLVTGGAGSIGSELCRQIATLSPARLVVLDKSESGLFEVEHELGARLGPDQLRIHLGDVCDAAMLGSVMSDHRPQLVFHAAAYKQVPMLETHVREAARNNVLGTRRLALAAIEHRCETFVLISTDKAVNPTNVMGATKRVAEMVCRDLGARAATRFVTVRFGNVLGSAGSVVPRFRRQIEAGGPVTVTHPEVTRYFMTITEACQLIVQSAMLGSGSEIFVLDMGEPVRIRYLAEQMILLSGRAPGEDIEIVYTGLRSGEKMNEELFHHDESLTATTHSKILRARTREVEHARVESVLARLEDASERFDEAAIEAALTELVPEFERMPPASVDNVVHLPQHARGEGSEP